MKKYLSVLTSLAATAIVIGQGTISFSNRFGNIVNAPVFDSNGVPLDGPGWRAGLYEGETMLGRWAPFRTGTGAGYWNPNPDSTRSASVVPGAEAVLTVRVWEASGGDSYAQALAAGKRVGQSAPFSVTTGGAGSPPTLPARLVNLRSFSVGATPSVAPSAPGLLVWQHQDGTLGHWALQENGEAQTYEFYNSGRPVDPAWRLVGAGDVNGDRDRDLVFSHEQGSLALWFMQRDKLLRSLVLARPGSLDASWQPVAFGDLDGDQKADIIWQRENAAVKTSFMHADGFRETRDLEPGRPTDARWRIAGTGSFDEDSFQDILWQHRDGTLAVWHMNGAKLTHAEFLSPSSPGAGWRLRAVTDVNHDSHADLIFQHEDGTLGVWMMSRARMTSARVIASRPGGSGWSLMGPWNQSAGF